MKLLREMDLYKALILACLVLMPACGWWLYTIEQSIQSCEKAVADATSPKGWLWEIGSLQKQVELVAQNRLSSVDAIQQPRTYFQSQIFAAAGQGLAANDFSLTDPKEERVTLSKQQKAKDFVAEVNWKNKSLSLPLEFVYSVIFNCESGARAGGGDTSGLQSIWKLRRLELVNATNEKLASPSTNAEIPPPELENKWTIKQMHFVRREPDR